MSLAHGYQISYCVNMDWNNKWLIALVGPLLTLVVLGFWRYTDNTAAEFRIVTGKVDTLDTKFEAKFERIDTKFDALDTKFDTKFDTLNTLLTENLIAINHDIGELKGLSHTHTPSQ